MSCAEVSAAQKTLDMKKAKPLTLLMSVLLFLACDPVSSADAPDGSVGRLDGSPCTLDSSSCGPDGAASFNPELVVQEKIGSRLNIQDSGAWWGEQLVKIVEFNGSVYTAAYVDESGARTAS